MVVLVLKPWRHGALIVWPPVFCVQSQDEEEVLLLGGVHESERSQGESHGLSMLILEQHFVQVRLVTMLTASNPG